MRDGKLRTLFPSFGGLTRSLETVEVKAKLRCVFMVGVLLSLVWYWASRAAASQLPASFAQTQIVTVSAASFASVLAPDSIAAAFGASLATRVEVATGQPRSFAGRGRITLFVKPSGNGASNTAEFEIGSGTTALANNAPIQITGPASSPWLAGEEVEINGTGFAASPREHLVQIIASGIQLSQRNPLAVTKCECDERTGHDRRLSL